MLKIEFEYKDDYSKNRYNKQECICSSIVECIKFYELGIDCEYRFLKITNLDTNTVEYCAK